MIFRSVVIKLWATTIFLVTLVLLFLTFLLLQFFENNSLQQTELQMKNIGQKSAQLIGSGREYSSSMNSVSDISDVYRAGSSVFVGNKYYTLASVHGVPKLNQQFFERDPQLSQALKKGRSVEKHGVFQLPGQSNVQAQLLVVGVPFHSKYNSGAVFVYQSLKVAQDASDRSKKLIYICTGLAIILTTFFAFFLSTRIGLPLRKMRSAVLQVARGNFDVNVPVITTDEIGELAVAFNSMRKKLKAYVTALRQEKEQLSGIIDNMADGVLLLDENSEIIASNPSSMHFLQSWNFEHSGNQDLWKITPDLIRDWLKKQSVDKKQTVHEVSVQGHFWVIILTPLFDDGKLRGAVAVLRDMTEERHLDQMKKSFIANVSHELRTPVSMIQGYSEAIIDDIAQTEQDKKEMAKIVLDESKRLGRLVSELLDLAKLEAGHFQLNKKSVLLTDFFNHVVNKFQKLAQAVEITLSFHCEFQDQDQFKLDPDRIDQVLTNLIDNALRHTPKSGTVTVEARLLLDALRVRVRDTGVGIAEEDLPFVFERFYKADKARTRGKAGTGLGLSIARNIIEAHGGEISVRSKKGEETTFEFTLPRNTEGDRKNEKSQ